MTSYNFSSLASDFRIDEDPSTSLTVRPSSSRFPRKHCSSALKTLNKQELNDFLGIDLNTHLASSILNSSDSQQSAPQLLSPSSPRVFHPISSIEEVLSPENPPVNEDIDAEELIEDEESKVKINHLGQQFDRIFSQASSFSEKVEEFFQEVKDLEERYSNWKQDFNEYGNFQGNILSALEYFNVNYDNFVDVLNHYFPKGKSHILGSLEAVDTTFTWTNCIAPLTLNIVKFCVSNQIKSDLESLQKRYRELKPDFENFDSSSSSSEVETIHRIQSCMDQLQRDITRDQQEALVKGQAKLDKLISKTNKFCKHAFNIFRQVRKIFEIKDSYKMQDRWVFHLQPRILVNINCPEPASSQQQLFEEVGTFLKSLEKCKTIHEVQRLLKEKGIKEEIPSTFDEWNKLFKGQRFRRHLVQCYYYSVNKRPFMNKSHIERILTKLKDDKNKKVERCSAWVDHHIDQCQNLNFAQTKAYFQELHIHIDRIQIPKNPDDAKLSPAERAVTEIDYQDLPQNKDEWNQCVQDPEFRKALVTQWIDYQETTGQLAMHMMRQALLSKNSIERKFLFFRGAEYVVSIASSMVRLVLCVPKTSVWLAASIVEVFVSDLAKIGIPGAGLIYVFYPLYPDMNFKIDSLIMTVAEHFFAVKYKPHEYSLLGYSLIFQIRWFELVRITHYFLSLFEQALLWINMRLVENCIMRLKKQPLDEDERYIKIAEIYERHRLKCKQEIQKLEASLDELILKDAKLAIHPRHANAIEDLVKVLKEISFNDVSPEVREFFEDNLGLELTEANKALMQEKVEQFFTAEEDQFIKNYQECHKSYLRV